MGFYFKKIDSMYESCGIDVGQALESISNRYVANTPAFPLQYRAFCKDGILRNKDYKYEVDFNKIFKDAKYEELVYVWGKLFSNIDTTMRIDVNCFCPTVVYCNGSEIFKSNIIQERYPENPNSIMIPLKQGWNHIVLKFKKTRAGFGGIFGGWLGKFNLYFIMPSLEREGQEGWIFTSPMSKELDTIPSMDMTEKDTGIEWHPYLNWNNDELNHFQMQRMYKNSANTFALGWTKCMFNHIGNHKYTLKGSHKGSITVYIDEKQVYSSDISGEFCEEITIGFGNGDIIVKSICNDENWGYCVQILDQGQVIPFESPCRVMGSNDKWIYLGRFAENDSINLNEIKNLDSTYFGVDGEIYWRLDMPNTWIRPYEPNTNFGKWNYPLGVTIYGLLHSAKELKNEATQKYIVNHIKRCCSTFKYSLWDKSEYGGATPVHTLLTSIDSLDDCGSFGSVVLEVAKYFDIDGVKEIADYVADYITNKQIRLEDGTFFRKNLMHHFHEDTLWADDLYMSVPFLCRYYQLTGDERYIDDAAKQFEGFKKYLYMPELKIMSHVYDFKHKSATNVPWGRGNGWVAFSLIELIEVLPQNHAKREQLIEMLNDLCEGYLALQDEQGMWHQVITDHDSYPETSCTSMFIYAFSKGVRYGWLNEPDRYVKAILKAWEALMTTSIDKYGNIHGVCRGSEFSFTPDYYKYDLLWNLNDTHGIGIVLLAGVEVNRLLNYLD